MKRIALLILALATALGVYLYLRPVPGLTAASQPLSTPRTQAAALPWPSGGQAALGAAGYGLLTSHDASVPVPIASIAKIITALAVLKQKPLPPGSQGPTITLNSSDVDLYNYYYTHAGSVALVTDGEQISEYQALEAMLLPSANNMADSLANWAFGSVAAYLTYANQMVKAMGLGQTTVGDTNGFSDMTTSTAADLVKLGLAALNVPVIAQITSQASAQVAAAGTITNTNVYLGKDGVFGIKTGNTDKAGGCYLFAAKRAVAGQTITLVGAVLGQPALIDAEAAGDGLAKASDAGFEPISVIAKNQALGYYNAPWGADAQFKSAKALSMLVWKGADIKITTSPAIVRAPFPAGGEAGNISIQSDDQVVSSPIILSQNMPAPSFWWRLTHG